MPSPTPTPTSMARRSKPRAGPRASGNRRSQRTSMTSERQAYIYVQLPGILNTVPAALLKVEKLRDGTFVGRFRYGDRYLERKDAIAFDPFKLPLGTTVQEFTKLKGIPAAVRDAGPDAWGRRVIEHKLERSPADLEEIDYLLNGPQDGAGYLSFGLKLEPPAPKRRYNRTHQLGKLRSEEHTSELQSPCNLVCRLLLEKKNTHYT